MILPTANNVMKKLTLPVFNVMNNITSMTSTVFAHHVAMPFLTAHSATIMVPQSNVHLATLTTTSTILRNARLVMNLS